MSDQPMQPQDEAPTEPLLPIVPEPLPSGAPYRAPEIPEVPAPLAMPRRVLPKVHPILGPALSVYAVLLWSFVIAGQFTTSWMGSGGPLESRHALLAVMVLTFSAWIAALVTSRRSLPARTGAHFFGRILGITSLAFVLFLFTIGVASIMGNASSSSHDFAIAAVLVLVALGAALVGPRWGWPDRPEPSARTRTVRMVLWFFGTAATLVAAAELAANG